MGTVQRAGSRLAARSAVFLLLSASQASLSASAPGLGTLRVKVVGGDGTTAVPQARITVPAAGVAGVTGLEGVAVLRLTAGHHLVQVRLVGYCPTVVGTDIVAGQTTSLRVQICQPAGVLAGLLVVPGAAVVAAGAGQAFTAMESWTGGSDAAATVTWSSTGGTISTSGQFTAGAAPGVYRVIAAAIAENIADTAEVTVGAPVIASDELTQDAVDDGVLVYDAAVDGPNCLDDEIATGAASFVLGRNALPPGTTSSTGTPCHTSAAVFGPTRGVWFGKETALPWTIGSDILPTIPPPLVNVPITVWVVDKGTGSATTLIDQITTLHLATAQALLTKSGAGMALVGDAGGAPIGVEDKTIAAEAAFLRTAAGGTCDLIGQIRSSAIYHPDRINIYYVSPITGRGLGSSGYACVVEGAPDILFVESQFGLTHTLAHEIGHAAGLVEPNWGHTHSNVGGFLLQTDGSPRNFMAYGASAAAGSPLYASRGQMFRMSLTARSWLNAPGSTGMSPREVTIGPNPPLVTCPCQADESLPDCPRAALTELTGPTTTTPATLPSCAVRLSIPAATVCVGHVVDVIGEYFSDPAATIPTLSGDHFWVSSAPSVAKAIEVTSGYNPSPGGGWSEGRITGVTAGTATVTMFAGGPTAAASLLVTVSTCP